ncbi:hypothetical protein EV1_039253 [Malus domestica]
MNFFLFILSLKHIFFFRIRLQIYPFYPHSAYPELSQAEVKVVIAYLLAMLGGKTTKTGGGGAVAVAATGCGGGVVAALAATEAKKEEKQANNDIRGERKEKEKNG